MTSTDGGLGTQASVGLRAGGGAAILVFGTLGVALPFLLRRLRDGAPWLLYTKAAAAGVVLALALVHLISDAFSTFAELEPGAPPLAAAATQHVSPRCPSSHAAQPAAAMARRPRMRAAGASALRAAGCGVATVSTYYVRRLGGRSRAWVLMRRAPAAQGRCIMTSPSRECSS